MKELFILVILFSLPSLLTCQEDPDKLINQRTAGVLLEYGQPFYSIPEDVRYYPFMIGGKFSIPVFKAEDIFNISADFYPHYVYVWLSDGDNSYEFGLNVRLSVNFALSANDVLSGKVGSGPHYYDYGNRRQAQGFIFSDYFLAAYSRRFYISKQPFSVEIEAGYRHISNAGIEEPNGGVSHFVFGIGLNYVFKNKQ